MHEIFPVTAGAVLGLSIGRIRNALLQWLTLLVLAVAIGLTASLISGEVELSLGFIPVDVAQVLVVALLARALTVVWQRRPV
jgi:hypothetical protein